jgi:hypothetical protein
MTGPAALDSAGRRRSPATLPGYHAGRPPRDKGRLYPAEGLPLNVIRRRLCHANLGTTSIYLQGIDTEEIIATIHARRAPLMSTTAGLRLVASRRPEPRERLARSRSAPALEGRANAATMSLRGFDTLAARQADPIATSSSAPSRHGRTVTHAAPPATATP